MAKSITPLLLLAGAAAAALLIAAHSQRVVCAIVPPSCSAAALTWSITCYAVLAIVAGLFALAAMRAGRSIHRQCTSTRSALQPLVALPSAAPHAELAALLGALRVEKRTRLIAFDRPVALCHGLLRPRLLLSTGSVHGLSGAEIEAMLRHEQAHLRRHDPLRLVAARAIADALPELPVLGHMAARLSLAQELAADRVALAAVGPEALGGALFKVGDALGPLEGQVVAVGAFSALDARIDQLLGVPQPALSPSSRTVLPALVALLLSPLFCVVLPLAWCAVLVLTVLGLVGRHRQHQGRRAGER